ncbi:MAG: type II toxin-antitoxin system VapC family toxin [Kineosporiaceae bacterium]
MGDRPVDVTASRGVLDTSVFVAAESGRPLATERLPDELATTAVTIGELEAGVLTAPDTATRARRLRTIEGASEIEVIPVDSGAALRWAEIRASLRDAGRRMPVNDAWIAACALSRDLPVVTQDDDYDAIADLVGLAVVRV